MKDKLKKLGLNLSSIFVTLAPLAIYVGINWDQYAPETTFGAIKLGIGGVTVAALAGIIVYSKTVPKGMSFWVIVAGLSWALQAVLASLFELSLMVLIGSGIDTVFIQTRIKDSEETRTMKKQAKLNAEAIGGRNYER
ncbi:MAG: hypothetical protein AB7E61_02420 [Acholeplasmataceae bacterium]